MTKFVPNTPTVNSDKEYLISDKSFYKRDFNVARGINEAFMMSLFDSCHIPHVKNFSIHDRYSELELELIPGHTLENCKDNLTADEKTLITNQLIGIFKDLKCKNVVHGDINESNVLYDKSSSMVFLLDFEFAKIEISNRDLTGPNWGIIHLLKYLYA